MKKLVRVIFVVMFPFIAISVFCAEVDGEWFGIKDGPDGETLAMRYRFKAEGNTLIGLIATRLGGGPISEGKIDGNSIEFKLVTPELTLMNNGKISGDELHLIETDGKIINEVILKRVDENKEVLKGVFSKDDK